MPERSRRRGHWKQLWALHTNAVREYNRPSKHPSRRTSASPVGSASLQAGRLERYREDDCSPCAKTMYIHMDKTLQTSSTMGSKGIRSNINRGIKISPYFDIDLNWHCHQSPAPLIPVSLTCRHPAVMPLCTPQARISRYPWKELQ